MKNQNPEYVGELIDADWTPTAKPVPPIEAPRLEGQPPFPAPGIYFGMPNEDYHAIPAASTSGLKRLSTSSMEFWADSWMNPDREEQARRDYFDFGSAIHAFVLEGEEVYQSRYAVDLDKDSYEDLLENVAQIKDAIARAGEKPVTKNADGHPAKKEDWIAQLLDLDPDAVIWDAITDAHAKEHAGKEIITHKIDKRVRIAARMIFAHQEIAESVRGGYPEVSVFWHCPVTGAPMKARFDYLKMNRIVDLKSFANRNGMPIDRAIEKTIANYKYTAQHVVYLEAAAAAKAMIRERGKDAIFLCDEDLTENTRGGGDFALKWAEQPEPDFLFIFQMSGNAPVTRGKIMPTESMGIFGATQRRIEELKRSFVANCEVYGTDAWLDIRPIEQIHDEDLPIWASEL